MISTKKAKTILEVKIQETEKDKKYHGSFAWSDVGSIEWSLNFKTSAFDERSYLPNGHEFIFSANGQPLPRALADEVSNLLFIPLAMAVSVLIDRRTKNRGSEATLKIPVISSEEENQFRNPMDILNYILELNS